MGLTADGAYVGEMFEELVQEEHSILVERFRTNSELLAVHHNKHTLNYLCVLFL